MSLSCLIVNWNSKHYLKECLRSIYRTCPHLIDQVVVVDSGSMDGCGVMLASDFPHVEFIQLEENVGFGIANNVGFERIRGDLLLLLNPDTEVSLGAVERLIDALLSLPAAGIVGPKLLNSDGSLQTSCVQAAPGPLNQALDCNFLRGLFPAWSLWGTCAAFAASEPVEVQAVSGACMLVRSDTFRRLGGFRSEFFMYGEDMDFCFRVRGLGLKIYHVPTVIVVHHCGGSSARRESQFSTVMMRVSGEAYMRLNHGTASAVLYRTLQGLSALVRLGLLLPAVLMLQGSKRSSALASLKKWWAVLRWVTGFPPVKVATPHPIS